jgi:hypothetical protein
VTNEPIILSHEQHVNEIAQGIKVVNLYDQDTDQIVDRLLREFFAPDRFEADLEIIRQCMERV